MAVHASVEFSQDYPDIYQNWYNFSKAITLLATKNEDHLKDLISKLSRANIKCSVFIEPDINNQVTSIAIEPSEAAYKLCSSIPLALKQYDSPNLINKHSDLEREVAA